MAKMRMVSTGLWNDTWIRTKLNPLDRYLFLYLLTNDHTNIAGIYELPIDVMSFETGLEREELREMVKRLRPKVWYVGGWVYFPNWDKHHKGTEKTQIGVENAKKLVPSHIVDKINEINTKLDMVQMPHNSPSGSSASALASALTSKEKVAEIDEKPSLPEWLNQEAWKLWLSYRSEIKKKLTPTTIKQQIKFLSENKASHIKIIENSIRNGWTGLFVVKDSGPKQSNDYARAHEKRIQADNEERESKESEKNNDALRKIREQMKTLSASKAIN